MRLAPIAVVLVALAAASAASASHAQESPNFAFNVGVASDYVFRGLRQAGAGASLHAGPQVFGGADVSTDALYIGAWASNSSFAGADAEIDVYGGIRPKLGPVSAEFGVIGYTFPGADRPHAAYYEFRASATLPLGPAVLGAKVNYSPQFTGDTGSAAYLEANVAYTLRNRLTLSAALGARTLGRADWGVSDYVTYNFGGTYPVTDHLLLGVSYVGTNQRAKVAGALLGTPAVDELVATLTASF